MIDARFRIVLGIAAVFLCFLLMILWLVLMQDNIIVLAVGGSLIGGIMLWTIIYAVYQHKTDASITRTDDSITKIDTSITNIDKRLAAIEIAIKEQKGKKK